MKKSLAAFSAIAFLGGCEAIGAVVSILNTTYETNAALQGEWIGVNGNAITVSGDVSKLTFVETRADGRQSTFEGGALAFGEAFRWTGTTINEIRGQVTPDGRRVNWSDGATWFRPPTDLNGITRDIRYTASPYQTPKLSDDVGELPAECRRLCEADLQCGAFTLNYPQASGAAPRCELYDKTEYQVGRKTEAAPGFYSGVLIARLSPFEADETYVLRSAWTGRALDVAQQDVVQVAMTAETLPAWAFEQVALDTFTIRNVASGLYLGANPDEVTPGTAYGIVYPEDVTAAKAQRFRVVRAGTSPSGLPKVRISPDLEYGRQVVSLTNDPKPFRTGKEAELTTGAGRQTEWEFVPHESAALFIEEDVQIDVLNQVLGPVYPAEGNFYLWYNDAPQAQFKGVAEMNFTKLVWDNVPFKDVISDVANFVLPDEVLDVVPSLERKTFTVPARAENVEVRATFSFPGLPGEELIGTVRYYDLSRKKTFCVNVTGVATPSDKTTDISDDCTRWGASTIKTYNQTGETVYVMWTDEINWSLANMGGGVITGLLVNNTQNVNTNFFRYFAVANAWGVSMPDESYDAFQALSICQKPNEMTPILTHSVFDMAQNALDIKSLVRSKPKDGEANNSNLREDVEAAGGFLRDQAEGFNEQSDEYKQTYRQYNPILAVADFAGGETKTIMAVNASLTKFWFIDSAIDENWIIRDNDIVLADDDNPSRLASGGRSSPVQALNPSLRKTTRLQDCLTKTDLLQTAAADATR